MIREVARTVIYYQTEDGSEYNTREEAEDHERKVMIEEWLLSKNYASGIIGKVDSTRDFIWDNRLELQALLLRVNQKSCHT